jgi:hypothetical protein
MQSIRCTRVSRVLLLAVLFWLFLPQVHSQPSAIPPLDYPTPWVFELERWADDRYILDELKKYGLPAF